MHNEMINPTDLGLLEKVALSAAVFFVVGSLFMS